MRAVKPAGEADDADDDQQFDESEGTVGSGFEPGSDGVHKAGYCIAFAYADD
jgi:hypothetical protein